MSPKVTTRFSSLPYEILLQILSFEVGTPITKQLVQFIAHFQSLNKKISSLPEIEKYFNDFWWKVFEQHYGVSEYSPHCLKLQFLKEEMSRKKTIRRNILLAKYIKFRVIRKQAKILKQDGFNVLMMGDGGVGKTAITTTFIHNKFTTEYDPTIEDYYRKEITLDGANYVGVQVTDLSGPEEYYAVRESYWRKGDCFIIVCDVTDENTVREAKVLLQRLIGVKDSNSFPVVFALNKIDFLEKEQRETIIEKYRNDIGYVARKDLENSSIIHSSAKTGENINYLFEECVRRALYGDSLMLLQGVITHDSNFIEMFLEGKKEGKDEPITDKTRKCSIM